MKTILASGSSRRKEILELTGIPFEIVVSHINEDLPITNPEELVLQLSKQKALAVQTMLTYKEPYQIIAADTVVTLNGEIFGKPIDENQNLEFLLKLNNTMHTVYTGVCVLVYDGECSCTTFVEKTDVYMGNNPLSLIKKVVNTKDGLDKAGGYGIQSYGGLLIKKIEGCYYNVIGLPLNKLTSYLDI